MDNVQIGDSNRVERYFSHARTALKYGLKSIDIRAHDQILLPDYTCDVVLHPINQLQLQYRYYSVRDDLSPDWSDIERKVEKRTKAILMIHYFGQPQNILRYLGQKPCFLQNT